MLVIQCRPPSEDAAQYSAGSAGRQRTPASFTASIATISSLSEVSPLTPTAPTTVPSALVMRTPPGTGTKRPCETCVAVRVAVPDDRVHARH